MTTTTVSCICGRNIHATTSATAEIGPTCVQKAGQVLADFSNDQIVKVVALLKSDRITRTGPALYTVASDDGVHIYTVTPASCTCPAGRNSRRCYHRGAILVLVATGGVR